MDIKETVSHLFIFENTDFSEIDEKYGICASLLLSTYSDGEIFFSSGADGLPVIISGNAVILSGSGEKAAVLRRLSPGEVFGAACVFEPEGSHRTVARSVGECTVALLPANVLVSLLGAVPRCSMNYIKFLSGRISFLNRKIAAFTAGCAEAKLAVYLLGLPSDGGVCRIPHSISELSSVLGIGRASIYRAFDDFTAHGIIYKDGKTIRILRPDALNNFIK